MKANSIDIAYRAGVSQSTVSRALRNSPLVNKATRERIQAIAKELNYKVDKNASNLRLKSSATIALLLFEDPTSDDSLINPFFLSMLGSITRACARSGYDLLVSFQQMNADWHADFEDSNKADGIILLANHSSPAQNFVDRLCMAQPFVIYCRQGRVAGLRRSQFVSAGCQPIHMSGWTA